MLSMISQLHFICSLLAADSDWQVIELPGAINKSEDATLLTLDNPENGGELCPHTIE